MCTPKTRQSLRQAHNERGFTREARREESDKRGPMSEVMLSEFENSGSSAPLAGWRILVSRARDQASALTDGLRALGSEVIEIPFIEIRQPRSFKSMDESLKLVAEYQWLILTSVNG